MVGYVAFGNDELATRPAVKWGDSFVCPRCGDVHKLTNGEPEGSKDRDLMLVYSCGGKDYLGAVAGRLVANAKPSAKGSL